MADYVSRYSVNSPWSPRNSLDSRPFALELLLAFCLLSFGYLLEFRIYLRPLFGFELQFCEPALIVDSNGSTVVHRLLDVVSVDVFPKDSRSRAVHFFYRSSSKSDKGRIR